MPWQPPRTSKGPTLALATALHLLLGLALIRGLAGQPLDPADESPVALDIALPPLLEPEPEPPLPDERASAARHAEGAPDLRAKAAPVVLPPPPQPLPTHNPLPTSDEPATEPGTAPSAGASALAGPGSGAGEEGGGAGAGGTGEGTGSGTGQAARLLSGNLTRRDYGRIRSFGSPRGSAVLAIEVGTDGRLTRCLAQTSSGDPALDAELCRLLQRTRWEPARDTAGQPAPVTLRYVASWDRD